MTATAASAPNTFLEKAERWMPGLLVARTYQRAWMARDLMAGVVLSALLVPQGMAYAELAGLPAITGLYATVVCLLAYAVFGPSPYLVLGPDSSLGPMIAAAIVIAASLSLFDVAALRRLSAVRRSEFILALVCILGVALVGVLQGNVIAVVLSILQFFKRAWQPHYAILGRTQQLAGYHDLERYPDADQIPGLLMLRWDAPLFFANANIFRQLIRDQMASFAYRAGELPRSTTPTPYWVLVAAEPITDVDTTAADMLVDLDEELNAAGVHLVFAELKDPVREKIERYGLLDTIDRRHFYPTLEVAIEEFYREA